MTTISPSDTPASTRRTDISRVPDHDTRNNVGQTERLAGGAIGGALAIYGLTRVTRSPMLGLAAIAAGGALLYRSTTGYCSAYGVLGISTAHEGEASAHDYFERGVHVEKSYTIARPAAELYAFWRDFSNLPRFMEHVDSIEQLSPTRSRWTVVGPLATRHTWDAEIIHDQPDQLIAWRSLAGADVDNAGSIHFTPLSENRGTEVRVVLDYIPPAGQIGHRLAQLFGKDPYTEIREDLRRFKQLMETGDVPTIEGQPKGYCRGS